MTGAGVVLAEREVIDGSKWSEKDREKMKFVYKPPQLLTSELMLQHHAGLLGNGTAREKVLPINPANAAHMSNNYSGFRHTWRVGIRGPGLYEDSLFLIDLHFPDLYPYLPPVILFKTPIFHPNVHPITGQVATTDVLLKAESWDFRKHNVEFLCAALKDLLKRPMVEKQNPFLFDPELAVPDAKSRDETFAGNSMDPKAVGVSPGDEGTRGSTSSGEGKRRTMLPGGGEAKKNIPVGSIYGEHLTRYLHNTIPSDSMDKVRMAVQDGSGWSPTNAGGNGKSPSANNGSPGGKSPSANQISPEVGGGGAGGSGAPRGMSFKAHADNPFAIQPEVRMQVAAMEQIPGGGLKRCIDFQYVQTKNLQKSQVVLNTFAAVLFKCHKAEYANYVNLFKKMYTLTKSMKEPNKYMPSLGEPTPLLN